MTPGTLLEPPGSPQAAHRPYVRGRGEPFTAFYA